MNYPIIQVYEIQNPREAEEMVELGVDHIGSVILSEKEWQIPAIREVVKTAQSGGVKSSIIPLFNNIDSVCQLLEYYMPDIIHFCELLVPGEAGKEAREKLVHLQYEIHRRYPAVLIMRSIPIPEDGEKTDFSFLELAAEFESVSDFFLTDTLLVSDENLSSLQPVSGFVGITGKTCDWDMARMLVQESFLPVILAGGLSPENVREAVSSVRPYGVDTCTATNMRDEKGNTIRFRKDIHRVKAFIQETRSISNKKNS